MFLYWMLWQLEAEPKRINGISLFTLDLLAKVIISNGQRDKFIERLSK